MKRVKVPQNIDNFNKGAGLYRYDNKSDELMMYCLELYPQESARFFGRGNDARKKMLQAKLRNAMDKSQEEQMLNASGGGRKFFKGLGRTIARASLVVPRGAALGLIRLNFRGVAKRFSLLNEKGKSKLNLKWKDLGGKTDKLNDAIKAGKDKKPFVCGKKCRSKAGANPSVDASDEFVNLTPETTALVSAGAGVVTTLIGVVGSKSSFKNQAELMRLESDLKQRDNEENAIDATMTSAEKKIADEIIKAQNSGADPIEAIRRNPNLTAEEKEAAIKSLQEITGSGGVNNKIIIGGIVLVAIGLIAYYFSSKTTSES
jgi:hypothetical protein